MTKVQKAQTATEKAYIMVYRVLRQQNNETAPAHVNERDQAQVLAMAEKWYPGMVAQCRAALELPRIERTHNCAWATWLIHHGIMC